MSLETTPRHALPLLSAGQAQKEIAHNEALILADFLLTPVAETLGDDTPPDDPAAGRAWIVGDAPDGDWAGRGGAIACRTAGGWRFVNPVEGMHVWLRGSGVFAVRGASGWSVGIVSAGALHIGNVQVVGDRKDAIPDASGGAIIDVEARSTIGAILIALREHGLISG